MSCYYYQENLCGSAGRHGSIGPAFTSNIKFYAPFNPVYYKPYDTTIYPVQPFKFVGKDDELDYNEFSTIIPRDQKSCSCSQN